MAVKARVGKRRTLVIPKEIAKELGIEEGSIVEIRVEEGRMIVEPALDAVWLALHGRKVASISTEELEEESVAQQEKYVKGSG